MSIFNQIKESATIEYDSPFLENQNSSEYLKLNGYPAGDTSIREDALDASLDMSQMGEYAQQAFFMDVAQEDALRRYLARSIQSEDLSVFLTNEGFDLKGLMGAPFKFSRTDDPPVSVKGSEYGRSYLEQYIEFGNIVAFTPGMAYFLPGLSEDERQKWLTNTTNSEGKTEDQIQLETDAVKAAIKEAGTKKLYTFRPASSMYWDYVNTIWRFMVKLSGLDEYDSRMAKYFATYVNGANYENGIVEEYVGNPNRLSSIRWGKVNDSSDLNRLLYSYVGNNGMSRTEGAYSFVPFYSDGPIQINEGFDNSSGESILGSKLNSIPGDDISRELGFLSGYTYRDKNDYNMSQADQTSKGKRRIDQLLSVKSFGVKTIIPDVWKDSGSAGRDYTFKFKFACCDGSPETYAFHTLRPLCHLLAMALPIHHQGNFAFASPLLVRVFAKGLPAIDVGLITSLQIEKDPRSVTTYGLMTDMTVTVTVRDLTPVVALPNNRMGIGAKSAIGFMSLLGGLTGCNTQLLNWETLDIAMNLDSVGEYFTFNNIKQSIGNTVSDTLGYVKAWFNGGLI